MKAIALLIAVVVSGQWLDVSWTPHPDNRWISTVYQCRAFRAVNVFDIQPNASAARIRRVETPAGERCWITVSVLRGGELDDPLSSGVVVETATIDVED